ncbi:MAG: hypothetical protein ABIR26_17740 [Ramlibacter sp.]
MTSRTSIFHRAVSIAHVRTPVAALMLLLPAAFALTALPVTALAQPALPEVRSLDVRTDADLGPGSRLSFRAVGTPRGQVMVRVRGVNERIALREVSPGTYVGRYTIKRGEAVREDRDVRLTLRVGNRTASAEYSLAEVMAGPPVASAPPPVAVPPPPALRIERFGVAPLERIEPGAELRFALDGIPGATVMIDLPGVANDVALREVRPGHYEGGYTLRRADTLNPSRPVVATLRLGDRTVTATLSGPLVQPQVDNRAPQLGNLMPRDGEAVPGGPTQISANFDDRGGSGVDPATVRINVSGRDFTPQAQVTPTSVSLRANLPPGRHSVEVTARDRAGNAVRREWSFEVASAVVVPVNLPLQVLNLRNNGSIEGGPTVVQGRTAAYATVEAKVDSSAPVPGGFSVGQHIYAQTLQADADGNFSFSFAPRFQIPGARYEIALVATKAGMSNETKVVLHQR